MIRLAKMLAVVALAATLGWHWALLQSIAWTTMLADNLRHHSLTEAVTRTLDGKHPCPLCRAITAAQKSEKKREFTLQTQKLEFPPAKETPVLLAPSNFQELPAPTSWSFETLPSKPPTPPPRGCCA